MVILYEDYAKTQPEYLTVHFQTRKSCDPLSLQTKIRSYLWVRKGLQLLDCTASETGGWVKLKVLPSFFEPFTMMAIATIVASATGLAGTLAKMWVVSTAINPLLAPGPLGFPMVFWLIVAAAGIAIPVAIIMKKK